MIKWLKNILSEGTVESSKRLCMVMSYTVSLAYAGACIFFHIALESNVLTLLLGALGGSTSGYVFGNKTAPKQEDKKDAD